MRMHTHAHVCGGADKGVRDGVDELARNAKVANLDLAMGVEENVRRLDVYREGQRRASNDLWLRTTMDDAMDVVKVCEALQHGESNLAHNANIDRTMLLVDPIEGSLVHELHANADVWVGNEGTIERDDMV